MSKYKYSEEELIIAVKESLCLRQVLSKLNIVAAGGNYFTVKKRIKNLNLDTSHFTGQGWSKNKKLPPKRSIEDYLTNKQFILSYALKNKLLEEKIFEHKCSNCNNTLWLDQQIPLELHHIDGNSENNHLDNLLLLCPNCHALTDNYRGKGKKK